MALRKVWCLPSKGLRQLTKARSVLQDNCDPVVRYRLLRDVLEISPDDDELIDARRKMLYSQHVLELKDAQMGDGGWGRFHSASEVQEKNQDY